ncbi:hypothetical protein Hneap_0523 [Halothiobacillus neapolitanus c2]|uniref:Uncharacterized protein n=1 Tax=Halothiobacillus neapolitanus (strain ATCC 23641 / DSM 15147 / CIP 104769 / NCIMB 8539 / c2) TaxID=555778 RepID=D0KY54_HALNC|nr:hypothetical protein Hneap_0523 [Halothiobacillus neapolitanus c2]TDN58364.1 hypothetical protein C8D83_10746 [Halothiobacillus neapolitanus]
MEQKHSNIFNDEQLEIPVIRRSRESGNDGFFKIP